MNKYILFSLSAFLLFINADCKKDPVTPIDELKPGRRDYVWIAGFGSQTWNLLWRFDGTRWKKDSVSRPIAPSALWGTANNNIWLGNYSFNTFWRYDGTKWYKFSEHSPPSGYDRVVISDCDVWFLRNNSSDI